MSELDSDRRVLQQYIPETGPRRAVAFEPRNASGWDRITYEYRSGAWIPTGLEIVAQLEITVDDASLGPGREGPTTTRP